ncbi:MAG: arginase family protein [Pseudomonadota bacterium]
MTDSWIVTPQYFEHAEPGLIGEAPAAAILNGPHPIAGRGAAEMATLHRPIAEAVAAALKAGERAVNLAGDCCAAVPALAGCQRAGLAPHIVWVDAHGDFNTPETSPSQFLGGMPLAMMVGRGPQWMMEAVDASPAPEASVTLVDGRDLDPLEAEAVAGSDLRHIDTDGLATLRIHGPVLLHIDLDVLDATAAPAFNYPVPGGPDAAALAAALRAFAAANDIRCISLSAWSPSKDGDGQTGAACRQALAPLFA